jgi:hypothetical protein
VRPKRHAGRLRYRRWEHLDDSGLLDSRFRDLKLSLKGTAIAEEVADLYAALTRRGIKFRPHVWLSTEWFSPDGVPGIAIPFYLAHPRLTRLERRIKGDAEGSTKSVRRQILRHEAGHALDTAFGLRRRADWRATFGRASRPYPSTYTARPASRRFVQHLGHWYAQSHPTEDFAETFAVWLQPKARWRRDYSAWPAIKKLEYVDELMQEIAGQRPAYADRAAPADIKTNARKLREHYRRHDAQVDVRERRYDAWLRRVFKSSASASRARSAYSFLRAIEGDLRRSLLRCDYVSPYLASQVVEMLRRRCRELDLVLPSNRRETRRRAARLHERVALDLLERNRERFFL